MCPTGEELGASITGFFRQHLDLVRLGLSRADTGAVARRQVVAEQVASLTYDRHPGDQRCLRRCA